MDITLFEDGDFFEDEADHLPRPKQTFLVDLGRANPKQEQLYKSRRLFIAYGGAKGGGKTHAVRVKAILGAARYSGIRILIVRRCYPELQQNHIEPLLRMLPRELARYNGSLHTLRFANGSLIKFGHFQNSSAEREYQGQEYDWIFLDEATQVTEREFRWLGACLRGTGEIPKRFYVMCNPGGTGHSWVKRLFIDRRFKKGENPEDYAFIFASVEDNSALLKASPQYISMLEALPENLVRAYRYGDWDALSGRYFSEFDEKLHVCEPFSVPKDWRRYRAFDYGLDALACLWVAVDREGTCYVYRELEQSGLIVSDGAQKIRLLTAGEQPEITYAPPDMWARQKDTGRTLADIWNGTGVYITKAPNDRVAGHMMIKESLRMRAETGKPRLAVFSSCARLIACLSTILADEENTSDCAKNPHDITHIVDALRYFCASRRAEAGLEEDGGGGDYDKFMLGRW
ncbi:MAG: phage terminase large subunit [Oscillospiraceae bacterium]|nr:phage terminase large subunit [Oscillospiraceae bacterium]